MAPKVAGVTARKNKKGLRSAPTSGDYKCRHCHQKFDADGYSEFQAHQNACEKLVEAARREAARREAERREALN